jgi:hypothetical protein
VPELAAKYVQVFDGGLTSARALFAEQHRMLLVLDEAQVLAESAHADLAHSLRASLNGRKQNIKVIFACGSAIAHHRHKARAYEPTR